MDSESHTKKERGQHTGVLVCRVVCAIMRCDCGGVREFVGRRVVAWWIEMEGK